MLITEFVEVKVNNRNYKHFQDLGYNIEEYGQNIMVSVKHLKKGSHAEVEVECDYCKERFIRIYQSHVKCRERDDRDTCIHCRHIKTEETCLDKYGVNTYSQTNECTEQIKETCLEKFGVDNYFRTEEHKIKIKEYWNNTSNEEINEIVNKRKETCLEKYGYENPSQIPEVKEKIIATCMDKYGYKNPMQHPKIRKKFIKTISDKDGVFTSSQQIEVCDMIKTLFNKDDVFLNYPFDYYILDIALFINKLKIDIEYDGWYWHSKKNDKSRNSYLKNRNWKVLRIKSGHKLPTIEQLQEKLDILINTNEKYQEIILDDWKEKEDIA